jgi:signal transduction histidine kinase
MNILQRHAGLRQAFVVFEQLVMAAIVYTIAILIWKELGSGKGRPGVVTVLLATAVVATLLVLSRRRFEQVVNWLAFGERADIYEMASGLLKGMATTLEVEDVLPRLAETAARTVGSHRGEVHVWLADGQSWRQTWPLNADEAKSDLAVAVHHGGEEVGEMLVSVETADLSPVDRRLLGDLVGPAGLALSTVRLTHALRQQAAEIESTSALIRASRERIVTARGIEQERLRQQLATRVQPHLDSASDLFQSPVPTDDDSVAGASRQVAEALEELRGLARGLFPARLYEAGLVEALHGWAEQAGRPVSLSCIGDVDRLRDEPEVSTALYFCAVTVMVGAQDTAILRILVRDEDALLEVRGRLDLGDLQSVSDRAEAFGGEVEGGAGSASGLDEESFVRARLPISGWRISGSQIATDWPS